MRIVRSLLTLLAVVSAWPIGPVANAQTTPSSQPPTVAAGSTTNAQPPPAGATGNTTNAQPPPAGATGNTTNAQPPPPSSSPSPKLPPTFDKTKIQQVMSDRNTTVVQKFDSLRDERRKVTAALAVLDNAYRISPALYETNPLQIQGTNNIYDKWVVLSWLNDWKAKVKSLQEEKAVTTDKAKIEKIESSLQIAEQWVAYDNNLLQGYDNLKSRWDRNKAELDQISADSNSDGDYLVAVDDAISSLINQDRTNDEFRREITVIFAVLVGIVIAGFFGLTMFNKNLMESIFSNDSGLQFVALFSIIIAIILFGVTNILEGRELSALLGAISGYILGRSTLAAASQPQSARQATSGVSSRQPASGATGPQPDLHQAQLADD